MHRTPMTVAEARENIEAMERETPTDAFKRLLQLALGPLGNLSDGAREIYAAKLSEM